MACFPLHRGDGLVMSLDLDGAAGPSFLAWLTLRDGRDSFLDMQDTARRAYRNYLLQVGVPSPAGTPGLSAGPAVPASPPPVYNIYMAGPGGDGPATSPASPMATSDAAKR